MTRLTVVACGVTGVVGFAVAEDFAVLVPASVVTVLACYVVAAVVGFAVAEDFAVLISSVSVITVVAFEVTVVSDVVVFTVVDTVLV